MVNPTRIHDPVPLDWSKLLGFDQFTRAGVNTGLQDAACAKVGNKEARAPGLQAPTCAKVGTKNP